jgi:hypothetical protein
MNMMIIIYNPAIDDPKHAAAGSAIAATQFVATPLKELP